MRECTSLPAGNPHSPQLFLTHPTCLPIIHNLHDTPLLPLIQRVQHAHILVIQGEAGGEHVRVLHDALWVVALGQRHEAALQAPADQDLRGGLAVFAGEREERLVGGFLVAHQWGVCFDEDRVRGAVVDDLGLLEPGV